MTENKIIFTLIGFLIQVYLFGQNIRPDTTFFKFQNGKDSIIAISYGPRQYKNITYFENGKISEVSYRIGKTKRYGSYSYYSNGKPRHISKEGAFRILRSKLWNEDGKIISIERQHPFGSTSHKQVYREKTYNIKGQLIKYEYMRRTVGCFDGEIKKNITIEYDGNGKIKSKVVRTKRSERKRQKKIQIRSKSSK